jgi:5-methyltetrahydrofolate--homocysteine methyltransferase
MEDLKVEKLLEELQEKVRKGDHVATVELIEKAIEGNIDPKKILNDGLIEGMMQIGDMFQKNQAFIPDMLQSSRAMARAMEKLEPVLKGASGDNLGKIIIGTVKADLHDIGKNLVRIMYKTVGFEVVDLGIDVTTDKFISAVKEHGGKVVSLSALITTTMNNQEETLMGLKAEFGSKVKVLVGGAPVTQEWADSIGADGYAGDAFGAAKLARSVIGA